MSIRSRFKAQKGLLYWLYSRRRELAADALAVFATVREARRGEDSFTRAAEQGSEALRVGAAPESTKRQWYGPGGGGMTRSEFFAATGIDPVPEFKEATRLRQYTQDQPIAWEFYKSTLGPDGDLLVIKRPISEGDHDMSEVPR